MSRLIIGIGVHLFEHALYFHDFDKYCQEADYLRSLNSLQGEAIGVMGKFPCTYLFKSAL